MELHINTESLLEHMRLVDEDLVKRAYGKSKGWSDKDYILSAALIGIMERLERLQGAILSLQRDT